MCSPTFIKSNKKRKNNESWIFSFFLPVGCTSVHAVSKKSDASCACRKPIFCTSGCNTNILRAMHQFACMNHTICISESPFKEERNLTVQQSSENAPAKLRNCRA